MIEMRETQGNSPIQTSRHTAVRQEISTFSNFLNTIQLRFRKVDFRIRQLKNCANNWKCLSDSKDHR